MISFCFHISYLLLITQYLYLYEYTVQCTLYIDWLIDSHCMYVFYYAFLYFLLACWSLVNSIRISMIANCCTRHISVLANILLNIWWPMPLFLDIYFIYRYRYNMEVDEEKIDTYCTIFRFGVCLWFCRLVVVLNLGCNGAVLMWMY